MDFLTDQQRANFASFNQRLGLASDELTHDTAAQTMTQAAHDGPVIISSNPGESHIPVKIVPVGSIAELNKMVGLPDDGDDSDVFYPDALPGHQTKLLQTANSKAELFSNLEDSTFENVKQAATAYLMGNAAKLAAHEPMINAMLFPGQVALATGSDLTIPAGQTYIVQGNNPVVLNYGRITVGTGAQIKVLTDTTLSTQIFVQQ